MTDVDRALTALALDRTSATLLVAEEPDVRHFIAEALVVAAGLFVLQCYASGFLRGLGLDAVAEAHGRRARELLKTVRARGVNEAELRPIAEETEALLREVRAHVPDAPPAARERGEAEVKAVLLEEGAPAGKASEIAANASRAVMGDA